MHIARNRNPMQQKLRLSIGTGEAQLFCMKSKVTLLKSVSLPGLVYSYHAINVKNWSHGYFRHCEYYWLDICLCELTIHSADGKSLRLRLWKYKAQSWRNITSRYNPVDVIFHEFSIFTNQSSVVMAHLVISKC